MDPKKLKEFAFIVRYGSLTRAAERLYTTQPTLSRAVDQLEAKVGEPLLIRTRHGVKPTELGSRVAEAGEKIIANEGEFESLLEQWRHGVRDEVRIGVGPMLEFAALGEFVANQVEQKGYATHFRCGSASLLLPELKKGELDLLLAPEFLNLEQSDTTRELVFHDDTRIFAGKGSRFYGHREQLEFHELEREKWIFSGASAGLFESTPESESDITPTQIFTGSVNLVLAMLEQRDVLVRLPARLMLMSGRIGPEHILNLKSGNVKRNIALWYQPDSLNRPAVREIYEKLKTYWHNRDNLITFPEDIAS
jgi:LysR family transcriptional regulator of abg operon